MKKLALVSLATALVASDAYGQWKTMNVVDEFGDPKGVVAVSSPVRSIQPMSFPYAAVEATIHVACSDVWFRFTESPNAPNMSFSSDGSLRVPLTHRSGTGGGEWSAVQTVGGKDLRLVGSANSEALSVIRSSHSETLAISLEWFGSGRAAFRWDLAGAGAAIQESCRN